ncbi:hypothetical protein VNO77_50180 [Canavalia gladiata]|uniref:Uncharacterized protein n=1 Tax=Canavalia gladiata TaxID=3824 RepID=A0AAN9JCF4_CANGL
MREKFEGQEFTDLFNLVTRAASYERLRKEKKQRRTSSKGTYYKDPSLEIAVVEYDSTPESEDEEAIAKSLRNKKSRELSAPSSSKEQKRVEEESVATVVALLSLSVGPFRIPVLLERMALFPWPRCLYRSHKSLCPVSLSKRSQIGLFFVVVAGVRATAFAGNQGHSLVRAYDSFIKEVSPIASKALIASSAFPFASLD